MDLVCQRCQENVFNRFTSQAFWLQDKKSGYQFPVSKTVSFKTSLAELQQPSRSKCNFCTLVLDCINESIKRGEYYEDDYRLNLYKGTFEWYVWFRLGKSKERRFQGHFYMACKPTSFPSIYEVHTMADDPAAQFCSLRDTKPDLTSPQIWTQVRHWVDECKAHHGDCPKSDECPIPTRVLEFLKLEPGQPLKMRLVTGSERRGRYVALSYSWGGKSTFQTTKATINDMEKGFPLESLPKTLRDAAKVVRILGLEHLWVDSLCIIQDSEEDKAQEIGNMKDVYSQAFLTIAASNSDAADQGFLDYKFKEQSLAVLPLICPSGAIRKLRLRKADWYQRTMEPLNTRGWALQEMILSPRLLDYTSLHVSWRCRSAMHNRLDREGRKFFEPETELETLKKLHSHSSSELSEIDIFQTWDYIVQQYTSRSLTFQKDKLLAVGGIASYFLRHLKDDYVAGHWRSDLPNSLLWRGRSRWRKSYDWPPLYRPADNLAPSWSWASVSGDSVDINPYLRERPPEPSNQFCILDCQTRPARSDQPFGQVNSGTLTLKCLMGHATPTSNVDDGAGWGAGLRLNGREAAVFPDDFDVWERQPQSKNSLICIELFRENEDFKVGFWSAKGWVSKGLCLESIGDGLYQRIACYEEHHREKRGSMFDKCAVQKISLV